MPYLDFDIEIRGAAGAYQVSARSDEGEVRETFALTLSDADRADAAKQIGPGVAAGMRRVGRALFDALFAGSIREHYGANQTAARNAGTALRIKLLVEPPELAALPWEILYDPDEAEHICLTRDLPLVRTLPAAQPLQALTVTPPLRILAMAASPASLSAIDIPAERARLEQALGPLVQAGRAQLHWVEDQTWRGLQSALQRGPWHIFHFLGHGGYDQDAQESFIALADEQNDLVPLGVAQIGRLLANQDALRLVLLIACGEFEATDAQLSGIAGTLIRRGLPAALVMQRAISTEAAQELTGSFYRAITNGLSVDEALVEARVAISMVPSSADWATPVLYSRAKGGALFEMPAAAGDAPAKTAPDPNSPLVKLRALAAQPAAEVKRPELRKLMAAAYDKAGLRTLCDDITGRIGQRVSIDDLGGDTTEIIALNLIQFLDRRGLLQALLDELKAR